MCYWCIHSTLTIPNLDFKEMYSRCGVAMSEDLLESIEKYSPEKKAEANKVIEDMERIAAGTMELAKGVVEMGRWLQAHEIPMALVTRNTRSTVDIFHSRLWTPAGLNQFQPVVTRDHERPVLPPKPDPAALLWIAEEWGLSLPTDEILMVGDSPANDIKFGRLAGVRTVLVDSERRHLEKQRGKGDDVPDIHLDSLAMLPWHIWQRSLALCRYSYQLCIVI